MLVEPLSGDLEIELTAWDGRTVETSGEPQIFCQLPPPPSRLADPRARLVWIPMWDHASAFDQAWWDALPATLRIVSFSEPVSRRARAAGLPTLDLRYFKDPSEAAPVDWSEGTIAFYWNRTGLVGPGFLADLCRRLHVAELLFLDRLDPGIGTGLHYALPPSVDGVPVTTVSVGDRARFLSSTQRANLMIAPRASEGVGMTFLEAMCRGACVVAYDAPTMSEYIRDGHNGLLFGQRPVATGERVRRALRLSTPTPYHVERAPSWSAATADRVRDLGAQARADHIEGFRHWRASLNRYASFLTEWEHAG